MSLRARAPAGGENMQRTPMHVWLVRPGSHRFGQFLLPYSQTGKQSPSPRTRARPGFSSLRLSLSLSVSLAFSVCLSVSVPVSLCHRLSVSLSLLCFAQGMGWGAVLLSLCLSVSLSLCLSVSLSRSLSVSLLLSLSLSPCVYSFLLSQTLRMRERPSFLSSRLACLALEGVPLCRPLCPSGLFTAPPFPLTPSAGVSST